jgi:hypothetical protein
MPGRMRDPGPGVQDRLLSGAVRADASTAAASDRTATAAARSARTEGVRRGGPAGDYEDWTVDALRSRAAELGIRGRSRMRRDALIQALRAR